MDNNLYQMPRAKTAQLIVTELADDVVLYNLTNDQLHTLNPTAAFVWRLCDGKTTVAAMTHQFAQAHQVADAEPIVWSALEQLAQQNLLDQPLTAPTLPPGLTRRDLIRRAAVGMFVLLPLVRTMVAPMPVHAQSTPTTTQDPSPPPPFPPPPIPPPPIPPPPIPPPPFSPPTSPPPPVSSIKPSSDAGETAAGSWW